MLSNLRRPPDKTPGELVVRDLGALRAEPTRAWTDAAAKRSTGFSTATSAQASVIQWQIDHLRTGR
jgi:hypothetical protein